MADSRIEKWRGWCEGSIRSQVLTMHLHRHAYQEVGAILDANAELPPSYFIEFMQDNYATTQSIAVRRQAESRARVRTLGRLLAEVEQDASRLTREFWLGLWSNDAVDLGFAQRAWDGRFAGGVGDHLDPAVPRGDLEALSDAAAAVTGYVDEYIAHSDARASAALPTFSELHAAVDMIGELFAKYVNLLTASSYATLVPAFQHDWKAIFRVPWIRE